jgi:hypothetical protein
MSNIKTIPITREYNPTKDLVNIEETCNFGEYATANSIDDITIINEKITGGATPVVKGSLVKTSTINGTKVCRGISFSYSIISQQTIIYDGNHIGVLPGLVQTIGVIPGAIEAKINYIPYEEPIEDEIQYNTSPPAAIDTSPVAPAPIDGDETQATKYITEIIPTTQEEWISTQIVKGGINRKVRNTHSIETLGEGEDLDPEEIINDLIPDNNTADRIGKLAIINSEKNKSVRVFPPVDFDLDLQALVEVSKSFNGASFKERIETQTICTYPGTPLADKFIIGFSGRGN